MVRIDTIRPPANPLSQVTIRHLVESDLPKLEWDGEFIHFRKFYADAFARGLSGTSVIWVAEIPTTNIIGQVFIQLICDNPELADGFQRAYLFSFRIKPPYRNLGIGSRMLVALENDLRQRGYQFLTLNVAKQNSAARRLYERRGFHVIAPDPGIWSYQDHMGILRHVEEPAYRMLKKL